MVVKVKFLDKQRLIPQGHEYTYLYDTSIDPEPLRVGEVVQAGKSRAIVTQVDVAYDEIRKWVDAGVAKHITRIPEDEVQQDS